MGKKNMLKAAKKPEPKKICRHEHLKFERGGMYIVCADEKCNYVWAAVGNCPGRIIQDYMAPLMGFTDLDIRSDPLAPPYQKPISKS